MKPEGSVKAYYPFWVILAIMLATLSCNAPDLDFSDELADLQATPTHTIEAVSPTEIPESTATPSPTPSVTETPAVPHGPTMTPMAGSANPTTPLTEEGPWLVYRAKEKLDWPSQDTFMFITNENGSGRQSLTSEALPPFESVVSPAGDRFAYILQAEDAGDDVPHLVIRGIPDGEVEIDLALVSPEIFDQVSEEEEVLEQILQAVSSDASIAWSPHGHYLAFTAALNDTNADLYRFDTWSDNIRQLTHEVNHAYQPSWASDGEWILHLEVERFDEDGEWDVAAMSASTFDGSEVKRLYTIDGPRQVVVIWVDETHYILVEETSAGYRNLLRGNLEGSSPRMVYQGPMSDPEDMSFDDLLSVAAYPLVDDDIAAGDSISSGVYLIDLNEGDPDLILPGAWRTVEWWQGKGTFIANGEEGTVYIRRTGEIVKEAPEITDPVALSPDGQWIVSYGESGAMLYTHIAVEVRQVLEAGVQEVIWDPSSSGFFLEVYLVGNPLSSHHLYVQAMDEWLLQVVDLDVKGVYFWAGPAVAAP